MSTLLEVTIDASTVAEVNSTVITSEQDHATSPADGGELLWQVPGISRGRMGAHGVDPVIRRRWPCATFFNSHLTQSVFHCVYKLQAGQAAGWLRHGCSFPGSPAGCLAEYAVACQTMDLHQTAVIIQLNLHSDCAFNPPALGEERIILVSVKVLQQSRDVFLLLGFDSRLGISCRLAESAALQMSHDRLMPDTLRLVVDLLPA